MKVLEGYDTLLLFLNRDGTHRELRKTTIPTALWKTMF